MITHEQFIKDFAGIVNLIRSHEFLRYTDNGEYYRKLKTASGLFFDTVKKRTGMVLPLIPDYTIFDGISAPTNADAKRIIKRISLAYKKEALKYPPESQKHTSYIYYAELWDNAADKL